MVMEGRKYRDENYDYRYGFNGKEDDKDFGDKQLIQDYGFRLYNPAIARFLSVDPLASSYPYNSPYAFAENNVISGIDAEGLGWVLRIYSPMLSKAYLKARKEGDIYAQRMITLYARTHHFEEQNQNSWGVRTIIGNSGMLSQKSSAAQLFWDANAADGMTVVTYDWVDRLKVETIVPDKKAYHIPSSDPTGLYAEALMYPTDIGLPKGLEGLDRVLNAEAYVMTLTGSGGFVSGGYEFLYTKHIGYFSYIGGSLNAVPSLGGNLEVGPAYFTNQGHRYSFPDPATWAGDSKAFGLNFVLGGTFGYGMEDGRKIWTFGTFGAGLGYKIPKIPDFFNAGHGKSFMTNMIGGTSIISNYSVNHGAWGANRMPSGQMNFIIGDRQFFNDGVDKPQSPFQLGLFNSIPKPTPFGF